MHVHWQTHCTTHTESRSHGLRDLSWLTCFCLFRFSRNYYFIDSHPVHSSCEFPLRAGPVQVMRVKWVCPAGMWGLRRHSCCSMRGGRGRDSGNWSPSTSDTPQAPVAAISKKKTKKTLGLSLYQRLFWENLTDTTWKLQFEMLQELHRKDVVL